MTMRELEGNTMSYATVLPIWDALRQRFAKTVNQLPEENLTMQLGSASIHGLLVHTAEVEFMFADWFFGKTKPDWAQLDSTATLQQYVELLTASNKFFTEAMQELPEEKWTIPVESPMGASTPLEAVGRLMYHTGMHAGQLSLIQKNGTIEVK